MPTSTAALKGFRAIARFRDHGVDVKSVAFTERNGPTDVATTAFGARAREREPHTSTTYCRRSPCWRIPRPSRARPASGACRLLVPSAVQCCDLRLRERNNTADHGLDA